MAGRSIGSDDEEEERRCTLIRRPRSNRRPLTEKFVALEERETTETTPQAEEIAAPEERQEEVPAVGVETEEERLQREKKMKGKEMAKPVKKKAKEASRSVVIREPAQVTHRVTEVEETDEEEAELRWERQTKKRQEDPLPRYNKTFIEMFNHLLGKMGKFKNPKWQEECEKRVTGGKKAKSGKKLHQPALQDLGTEEKFLKYITGIGFEWLLENEMLEVSMALAKEFFTSFRFKTTTDLDEQSISFRVCDRDMRMNLTEWSVRLGLYIAEQTVAGEWFGRDIGLPWSNPDFDPQSAWRLITHARAPTYKPTQSSGNHIADPMLRLA